jgi:hypothetical protein
MLFYAPRQKTSGENIDEQLLFRLAESIPILWWMPHIDNVI